MFYYGVPKFQLTWYQKQKDLLEQKIKKQKAEMESDIHSFEKRLQGH